MINVDFIDSSEVTTERIYQWDIGRKLKISNTGSAIAPVVHFCNKKSEKALAVESIISGDFYIASVPNSLLQEEYDIIAYIYVGSEEEAKTIKVVHIPVSKRLKPETYVTTEDENVVDFLAISAEMKSLLDGLVITEYDSTKNYIKPNIVYYNGSSYICTSETTITNILPTDTTKWGLMCESGANVSEITFSGDALHFKLQNNDIVDVPLGSVEISVVEVNPVAFNITQDENGVLKIGDTIIVRKQLLYNQEAKSVAVSGLNNGDVVEIKTTSGTVKTTIGSSGSSSTISKIKFFANNVYFQTILVTASTSEIAISSNSVKAIIIDENANTVKPFTVSSIGDVFITEIYKIIE